MRFICPLIILTKDYFFVDIPRKNFKQNLEASYIMHVDFPNNYKIASTQRAEATFSWYELACEK